MGAKRLSAMLGNQSNSGSNPFVKNQKPKKPRLPAPVLLQRDFYIGIGQYDRGHKVWDPNATNEETGLPEPGWVHQENKTLECVIIFSVNEEKGTGKQIVPASEFVEFVGVLREILDSDFKGAERASRERYIPTYEVARESWKLVRPKVENAEGKMVEDTSAEPLLVSILSHGGKGVKPMVVPKNEFKDVVELLEGIGADLDSYVQSAWKEYREATGNNLPTTFKIPSPVSESVEEELNTPDSDE